ncbi:MAG: hypothetical protein H2069_10200 [Legionella sp.]|nr:hypothetical protein [Legionella sp.]
MTIKKNALHNVVNSSFIRRTGRFEEQATEEASELRSKYSKLAPYDDPQDIPVAEWKTSLEQTSYKDFDLKMLSPTELKILNYIKTVLNKDGLTSPIYLSELSIQLGNPISTLKKMFQKLEMKRLLARTQYKAGRGGWTIYSMGKELRLKLEKGAELSR